MDSKHRALGFVVLVFMVATAGSCANLDESLWQPTPSTPTTSTPTPVSEKVVGNVASSFLWKKDWVPTQPETQFYFRCDIAFAGTIEIEALNSRIANYLGDDTVCLGAIEGGSVPLLCNEVTAFEAYAATVAACYSKISKVISTTAKDALGDGWAQQVLPQLSPIWSTPPEEVNALSSRVSMAILDLMTGGNGAEQVAGVPLCFPTGGESPEVAVEEVTRKMRSIIDEVGQSVRGVADALRGGVHVQVSDELKLAFSIQFHEIAGPELAPMECRFQRR